VAKKIEVRYPPSFPGVQRAWWYLREGFERIGCKVIDDAQLLEEGHWSPPRSLPMAVHIAVLKVNGKRVWYDCSDFTPCHPELGEPYFAKNVLLEDSPPVIPLGQYLGSEPQLFFKNLPRLRELTQHKTIDVLAVFSNIDEGKRGSGLRRKVVERLQGRPNVVAGLWQWNHNRPTVPPELQADTVPLLAHWERIAQSKVVICLPGVGGESTRLRTETLAIGSCVLTVNSKQAWPVPPLGWLYDSPGNPIEDVIDRAIAHPDDREMVAQQGRGYFDEYLTPEAMARRVVREVV